ncbi:MAG: hypothetical protein H5T85_09170, partial [Actinobacteria bacterium]|nr:hypothetical protein [Actinomycetota bacterium]
DIFTGKSSPRFLIRLDWTNVLRGEEYPLLTHKFEYVPVASILNAVRVGADGVVVSHLLGYGDEIEANSFRNLNKVIRDSYNEGLPVFAHFCPFGPGISEERFDIAVEMGVSMEFEAGVDAIFVPEVKGQTYENIRKFCSIPLFVWIKDKGITVNALLESINCGIKGFVFGKDFFVNRKALDHLLKLVKEFDEQDFKK